MNRNLQRKVWSIIVSTVILFLQCNIVYASETPISTESLIEEGQRINASSNSFKYRTVSGTFHSPGTFGWGPSIGGYYEAYDSEASSFIIMDNGDLYGWGSNEYGQMAGSSSQKAYTNYAKILDNVKSVTSSDHVLALKNDGSLWAWGRNNKGQLGNGTNTDSNIPIKIMDNVLSMEVSSTNSVVLKSDGSMWAWGENEFGQLGNGTKTASNIPIKIMDNVKYAYSSEGHCAALKTDGSFWIWGNNNSLEFGLPVNESQVMRESEKPIKVMDNVKMASLGNVFTLVLKNDNTLWVSGTLGVDGYGEFTKILDNVAFIDSGADYAMIVKTDKSLWGLGANKEGQLGYSGYSTDIVGDKEEWHRIYIRAEKYPVKILDSVNAVSAGTLHAMAIKSDGTVWQWGHNWSNGVYRQTTALVPVAKKALDSVSITALENSNNTVEITLGDKLKYETFIFNSKKDVITGTYSEGFTSNTGEMYMRLDTALIELQQKGIDYGVQYNPSNGMITFVKGRKFKPKEKIYQSEKVVLQEVKATMIDYTNNLGTINFSVYIGNDFVYVPFRTVSLIAQLEAAYK